MHFFLLCGIVTIESGTDQLGTEKDRKSIIVAQFKLPALDIYLTHWAIGHQTIGSGAVDQEILDQVNTLVGAGFDTTAASLAWMRKYEPADLFGDLPLTFAEPPRRPWPKPS